MIQNFTAEYDKNARYREVEARYEKALRAALKDKDILRRVDLMRDYRRELLTETGMETNGPAAMYHFKDVGRAVSSAAWCLCGKEPGYTGRERPRAALVHVGDAFGWRYIRGLQALQDGLVETRVPFDQREHLRVRCNIFELEFRQKLEGANAVNDRGQAPAEAGEVLTLLVDHMRGLCGWIELTRQHSVTLELEANLQQATAYLQDVPIAYDARSKSSTNRWQF